MCKPTIINITTLDGRREIQKGQRVNVPQETSLTCLQRVLEFSAGELSQPGQPGHLGPQVSLYGFVCW